MTTFKVEFYVKILPTNRTSNHQCFGFFLFLEKNKSLKLHVDVYKVYKNMQLTCTYAAEAGCGSFS